MPISYGRSTADLSDVTVVSLPEILARDYQSTPLIKNLIDVTEAVIWGGPPGVGKSALTCLVGLHGGAAPQPNMFNLFEIKRRFNTLIVQSEVTGKYIKSRFNLFLKYWPDLIKGVPKIHFMGRGDSCRITSKFSEQKFQELLIKAIIENDIDLVIVDPLISFIDGLSENDNAAMRRELDCLKKACEYAGAAVILIHHTGKDSKGLRGASAIDGWADRIILIQPEIKDGDECFRLVFEKTRNQEKIAPILVKKTGLKFERVSDFNEDAMDVVVEALREFSDEHAESQTTLIEKMRQFNEMTTSSARRRIMKALKAGIIREVSHGPSKGYRLSNDKED